MKLTVAGVLTLVAFFMVLGWLILAWLLMITVGVAHADWLHMMPTIGWHASLVLAIPLTFLAGALAGVSHDSK